MSFQDLCISRRYAVQADELVFQSDAQHFHLTVVALRSASAGEKYFCKEYRSSQAEAAFSDQTVTKSPI